MEPNTDVHVKNIKQIYNGNVSVYRPALLGKQHAVYIAQYQDTKTVFRFSKLECALRNKDISRVLTRYGFTVPFISVHKIGTEYCEVYPFIKGYTLAERATQDISPEQIQRIYKQMVDISHDLTKIPGYEINGNYNVNVTWHEKAIDTYFNVLNNTKRRICHNDLHDKNILLDNQDNVCALLDLDAINKGSLVLAMIKMMNYAKKYGYNMEDLKYLSPDIYNGKIICLNQQMKIYTCIRDVYRLITGQYFKDKHTLQNLQK